LCATGDIILQIPAPGSCSIGLAFDGKYLWIAGRKADSLFQVERESGKVIKGIRTPGYYTTGLV